MAERCFGQQLLEADGCNPSFFYLLSKENKRSLKSCELHIPLTILFEQGYVKALFATEQASERASHHVSSNRGGAGGHESPKSKAPKVKTGIKRRQLFKAKGGKGGGASSDDDDDDDADMPEPPGEIKRKSGKDVDLVEVYEQFVASTKEGDIVAELLFAKVPGGEMNSVQFLDAKMLHRFFFVDVDKPKSLLQQFIKPKGNNNFKILATWSPLMIMAEGRRCTNSLTSRHLPVSVRGTTFEDATIGAVDVVVNRTVVQGINEVCCEMAAHFERTEKLSLTRFGGYFKVDENNKLYLMYPTTMRMHECDAIDKVRAPVNLSTKVDLAKTDIAQRPKDAIAKKALDGMDAILREHDAKMRNGSMIINIPSLEDNYSLIRNALHGTKVVSSSHNNSSKQTNRSFGKSAHGTSSVYVDGPLPPGMTTSTVRSASSMGGGGGINNISAINTSGATRRAHSAMAMANAYNNNDGDDSQQQLNNTYGGAYEKGIGAHSNTSYANPKPSTTSTRKTFYSCNMAGTAGSNPHASDPAMSLHATGNNSANIGSYQQHIANNRSAPLPINRSQGGGMQSRGGGNGNANTSSSFATKPGGGKTITITPNTSLPQPQPLMRFQHQLPNSSTNMATIGDANTNATAGAGNGGLGLAAMAGQQPITLRQLNRRTEKQIQGDWQNFINQTNSDLQHWEQREQHNAMRAARLGIPLGGGGVGGGAAAMGSSPTLNDSYQKVAALESAQQQQREQMLLAAAALGGGGGYTPNGTPFVIDPHTGLPMSPSRMKPPPVKAHSTYDPKRPHKALHVVHEDGMMGGGDNPNNTTTGVGSLAEEKASYMNLVHRRVGSPIGGQQRGSSPHNSSTANNINGGGGAVSGQLQQGMTLSPYSSLKNNLTANDNGTNTIGASTPIMAPADYEADAKLFLSAIQKEYQNYQQLHSPSPMVKEAQNSLNKVSKSVLLPSVFTPVKGGGADSYMGGGGGGGISSPIGRTVSNTNRSTGGVTPQSAALKPISASAFANQADREPAGLGGGGFGSSSPNATKASSSRPPVTIQNPPVSTGGGMHTNSSRKGAAGGGGMSPSTNTFNNNGSQSPATAYSLDAPSSSGYYGGGGYDPNNSPNRLRTSDLNFIKGLEAERAAAEMEAVEKKKTEVAILLQNLSPADREKLEDQTEALIADFKQYLSELCYAVYDLFLMRREGDKVHRYAYLEVPTRFQGFVTAATLNAMLWKLHGKVKPTLKLLCDTMPQQDPNYSDVLEWRDFLLSNLQVGSLGRNWPCRNNFSCLGEFLEYVTTRVNGRTNLVVDEIVLAEVEARKQRVAVASGRVGAGGGNSDAGDDDDANFMLDGPADDDDANAQTAAFSEGGGIDANKKKTATKTIFKRRTSGDTVGLPVSAVRRRSIANAAADLAAANGTAGGGTSANVAAGRNKRQGGGGKGANTTPTTSSLDVSDPANRQFTVSEIIREFKEASRKQKISIVSERMAKYQQEQARIKMQTKVAAASPDPSSPTTAATDPSSAANTTTAQLDELDFLDELEEDDTKEEILEDETVRSFNKHFCIVLPLLDERGLEIVKTEGLIVDGDAAGFLDLQHGVVPLLARWYLLDKLNESSHKDQRIAKRRRARKALKEQQDEKDKQSFRKELGKAFGIGGRGSASSDDGTSTAASPAGSFTAATGRASHVGSSAAPSAAQQFSKGALTPISGGVKFTESNLSDAAAQQQAAKNSPTPNNILLPQGPPNGPGNTTARTNSGMGGLTIGPNPLDVVCQRCNSCRILCVCDRVYLASGGARLRPAGGGGGGRH